MASPPSTANTDKKAAKEAKKTPPDERFWKRYSPHYELPISSGTSLAIHVLVLTLLVVGGVLATRLGLDSLPPPAEGIVIAGGGGNPQGQGKGPGTGIVPSGKDVVEPDKEPPKVAGTEQKAPEVQKIEPRPEAILPKESSQTSRPIDDDAARVLGQLSDIGKSANDRIQGLIAGKGRGGSGEGGGKGRGKGTGEGDLEGPGRGKVEQRQKRQLRWTMIFNTVNGQDYLRQLNGLEAILAIPGPDGQYQVIRDLMKRPVQMKVEDLASLDRIYWVDDKPQSVHSLAQALGLPRPPDHIAAFFPPKLERDLLDKELKYLRNKGSEDDILETKFQVSRKGDHYEPVVVDQKVKRR
jgi:hypothetical protein